MDFDKHILAAYCDIYTYGNAYVYSYFYSASFYDNGLAGSH